MSELTPQQMAEACAAAMSAEDAATRALGMQITMIAPGRATVAMWLKSQMTNGHGTCHDGYIFTLADSAFAFACYGYNQRAVAQHCNITYTAPAFEGDDLTADAHEVSRQGRGGIYDVRVTNQAGVTIAEFRGNSRTVKGTHLPETA